MKLVVTGSNGFLGKTLCSNLINNKDLQIFGISRNKCGLKSNNFHDIQCDLNDFKKIKEIFDNINPDIVYHFAANPLVKDASTSVLETNVIMTDKILKCSKNSNFVFASSATVYGQSTSELPFKVNNKLNPESIYAVSKVHAEELVKFYGRTKYINNYLIYRYVANVGKYSTHGVLRDLIYKIQNSNNKSIDIIGSYPGTVKPFTLASQSMKITHKYTMSLLHGNKSNNIINMSPKDSISVNDILDIITNILNINVSKNWLGESSMWLGDQKYLYIHSIIANKFLPSKMAIELGCKEILGKNI